MNAAMFNTTFWRVVWVTEGRRRLFTTLEERRTAQLLVRDLARADNVKAHQVNAQDDQLHAFFELPEALEAQAEKIFAYYKSAVENSLLAQYPQPIRIWNDQNFCERIELGARFRTGS